MRLDDLPRPPDTPALRRLALAAAVIDDIDLEPYGEGVVLRDGPPVEVPWDELRRSLNGADPGGEIARHLVARALRGHRLLASTDPAQLAEAARPVGFAVDSVTHPGLDWVQVRVLGGVLDLGVAFAGLGNDPDTLAVVPGACFVSAGIDPAGWWEPASAYLERIAALAVERLRVTHATVLRPMGDCDVITLLGSRVFRGALAAGDGTGMRAVAVPMRTRGWVDLARIDPAFVLAAVTATQETERGFPRPLLVTADELTLAPEGGRPAEIVLRDGASAAPAMRDVRWR